MAQLVIDRSTGAVLGTLAGEDGSHFTYSRKTRGGAVRFGLARRDRSEVR